MHSRHQCMYVPQCTRNNNVRSPYNKQVAATVTQLKSYLQVNIVNTKQHESQRKTDHSLQYYYNQKRHLDLLPSSSDIYNSQKNTADSRHYDKQYITIYTHKLCTPGCRCVTPLRSHSVEQGQVLTKSSLLPSHHWSLHQTGIYASMLVSMHQHEHARTHYNHPPPPL